MITGPLAFLLGVCQKEGYQVPEPHYRNKEWKGMEVFSHVPVSVTL